MSSELVSLREFARRKNWNPGYVHKLKVAGRLVMVGDKVDVQQSEQRLAESADPARAHLARSQAPAPQSSDPVDEPITPPSAGSAGGLSGNATFNRAKTVSQVFDAKLRELEYKRAIGSVIDLTEATRLATTAFRSLRDAVLNVPSRIKDQLASEDDALACERLVEDELIAALSSFDPTKVTHDSDTDDAE